MSDTEGTATEGGKHRGRTAPHEVPEAGPDRGSSVGAGKPKAQKAGLFDIRTFIAMLLGIYGVVLVIMGLVGTSTSELDRTDGFNVNLWVGIGLIAAAVFFEAWRRLRPVRVPTDTDAAEPRPQH